MSVYSNPAEGAAEDAAAYIAAVLDLLGDEDPMAVLGSTASWCSEFTGHLTPDQVATPETEGKWSVNGVLQHLADSELVWGYRLRKVLAEDRPELTGYDQDLWANRLRYDAAEHGEALSTFSALRSANLQLLSRVSPVDLDRVGVHGERGEESVRHMIRLYAGHDLVHRNQLKRVVARFA